MSGTRKATLRRLHDSRFATRYFIGSGVDIGAGPDPLSQYAEYFPGMHSCRVWDLSDGDAQKMQNAEDASFDFVHSSHCLEHMRDPIEAMANWIRIVKPGGHLVIMVPDEDLYEQGVFPSTFNDDHKWTFTTHKQNTWSPRSLNVLDMLGKFSDQLQVLKVELLDAGFRHRAQRFDQTRTFTAECGIELVVRKWLPQELVRKGRLPAPAAVAAPQLSLEKKP